jgi:hypothetical protein
MEGSSSCFFSVTPKPGVNRNYKNVFGGSILLHNFFLLDYENELENWL